jgi:hypothetical protein
LASFCVGLAFVIIMIVNLVPNGCRASLRREEREWTF